MCVWVSTPFLLLSSHTATPVNSSARYVGDGIVHVTRQGDMNDGKWLASHSIAFAHSAWEISLPSFLSPFMCLEYDVHSHCVCIYQENESIGNGAIPRNKIHKYSIVSIFCSSINPLHENGVPIKVSVGFIKCTCTCMNRNWTGVNGYSFSSPFLLLDIWCSLFNHWCLLKLQLQQQQQQPSVKNCNEDIYANTQSQLILHSASTMPFTYTMVCSVSSVLSSPTEHTRHTRSNGKHKHAKGK